jgi:hypothetical protein
MAQHQSIDKEGEKSFSGLIPITAPVPPMLEKAIGYSGFAHFVSFYWTFKEDRAYYFDGMVGSTGEDHAYLEYIQHPEIKQLLTDYHLGDSKNEAQHALILDREERKLYVALLKDTESFLSQHWPKIDYEKYDELKMPEEEYVPLINAQIINALKDVKQHDGRRVTLYHPFISIEERRALIEALQNWLRHRLLN